MSYMTKVRTGNAKLAVVGSATETEESDPVLGDGDGEEGYDPAELRLICLEHASVCIASDPELGDPVDMARKMYKFILEG